MQQSSVQVDPTVCHSTCVATKTVCGLAYFEDKGDQDKFVKEVVRHYRLMVFFKNYSYEGPSDILSVYLWVVISHCLKTIEKEQTEDGAKKKLMEIARETIAKHGDRNYFMGGLIKEGSDASEANLNQSYLKGLKELVVHELLKTLFHAGQRSNDFKYWVGLSKRKFLGLSYTGL